MYYSREELVHKYRKMLKGHERRLELERIRFNNELNELKRKARIARLLDLQGRYPWEEGYE